MKHDTASFSSASVIMQAATTTHENSKLKNPFALTSRTEVVDKPTATIVGYNDLGKSLAPLSGN